MTCWIFQEFTAKDAKIAKLSSKFFASFALFAVDYSYR